MRIHHIAIWTFRLEEMKEFYIRYFKGTSNKKYVNPQKGFESYFIRFDCGADLELMSRTDVQNTPIGGKQARFDPLRLCTRQQRRGSRTDGKAAKCRIYHQRRTPYIGRRIF